MAANITIICPGRQAGGANLLLSRTAMCLAREFGMSVTIVDFEDGATRSAWQRGGIPFDFKPYEVGAPIDIGHADAVIISLLGARLFPSRLQGNLDARLIAWCTAPQDAFKFLPPAYFFNDWSWTSKRIVARQLFSAQSARIASFLREGSRRGGVIFMDSHCHAVNEQLFGPGIPASIVPICTAIPGKGPRDEAPGTRKAYWVGRVTDFKTEPFIALTRELLKSGSPVGEVAVVGDGADVARAKRELQGLSIKWLGYLEPSKIDAELFDKADLIYGHGTALLEGAKLGIPSLLVDATYDQIGPGEVRAEWLHRCPAAYVGKIAPFSEFIGRPVPECLADLFSTGRSIGLADHRHWLEHHHPLVVAARLAKVISTGDYSCADFIASGAVRPGLVGSIMEWSKEKLFGRKY